MTFIDERLNRLSNVISVATARTMFRKGCEAYLAYVIDMKKVEPSLSDIPTVCDYPNVFPKEFCGISSIERLSLQLTLFQVLLRHPLHCIEWLQ